MKDQALCHWDTIARIKKSTWNLETWRPDVSYARTIAALCNPK